MVDVFAVLSKHAEAKLVLIPGDPWTYTGKWRCMCGEVIDSENVPVDAFPSTTRYVLRRHQAAVLTELIMSKGEVLRREAEWLERSVEAASAKPYPHRYSSEYLAGARASAGWVRFHSENPENYHHLNTSKEREQEDAESKAQADQQAVGDQGAVEGPGV